MRWIEQDLRHAMALAAGGAVALALFLLMHALIATNPRLRATGSAWNPVDIVTVHHDTPVHHRKRIPAKPRPVKAPPTIGKMTTPRTRRRIARPHIAVTPWSLGPDGPALVPGSYRAPGSVPGGALTPRIRIAPLYPPQAAYQGVEGAVTTCFTVQGDGNVADARVVGASSPQARRLLGQAALGAILQWKFVPRTVHGHAVATKDVCQAIHFRLDR